MARGSRVNAKAITESEFLAGALQYAGAKQAYDELVRAGVAEEILRSWLWVSAQLERVLRRPAGRPQVGGLPKKRLRDLASNVKQWAKKIAVVEGAIKKDPMTSAWRELLASRPMPVEFGATPTTHNFATNIADFDRLVEILFLYSSYLRLMDSFATGSRKIARKRLSDLRERFIEYVISVTGTPHYNQLADLLTGAYSAAGISEIVQPHALEMSYYRYKQTGGLE